MMESMALEVVELLTSKGINALTAFPNEQLAREMEHIVAVKIKQASIGSSGFGNYLGTCDDGEETGFLCDCVVQLTMYIPTNGGAIAAAQLTDKLLAALLFGGGSTLPQLSFTATEYDSVSRMLKQNCELSVKYWVVQTADDTGEFTDFTVKGMILYGN